MNQYKRTKINKTLIIVAIVLIVIAIVSTIIYFVFKNNKKEIDYQDKVIAQNYFVDITINLETKEVERDSNETKLEKEFNISNEQATLILNSQEELKKFFIDTTFEINIENQIVHITNPYQTKKVILQVSELKGNFNAEKIEEIQEGVYILSFDTQKRTKEAYQYLSTLDWITKIQLDEVSIVESINDESQTVYGEENNNDNIEQEYNTYGVKAMGLDNYQNIIMENGNPSEIIIATIGYGACIDNPYFGGRISDNYYNFIEDSKNIYETKPQGSRILEVIKESTTHNVKIMPLVVVNDEGYTTTASIINAISYATKNSDVICYELLNTENDIIDLILKNAFKENVPVSCVTVATEEDNKNYPANNSTTIAISSLDKASKITNYSGTGNYIDFAAYSTDVEEIFNTSSSVSRWSGASYSNAHIASAIALIKTYHKDYTILEVYNMLRNYCIDLGQQGKDEEYGYGCPNFSQLTISDIDKTSPQIQDVIYDNENWTVARSVQIKAIDEIRILGWAITNSDKQPEEWNKLATLSSTLDITTEIQENGVHYVWVTDSAGNVINRSIEINKVDKTAPEIKYTIDNSTQEENGYVTINVIATDEESGLHETAYSWDGINWGADSNILKVTENGRYKVYVRDALENIVEKEIKVTSFAQEGVATIEEGEIIKSIVVSSSWNGDTNNAVRISFNEGLDIVGWQITENDEVPTDFNTIYMDLEDEVYNHDENNYITNDIIFNTINDTISNITNSNTATNNILSNETNDLQSDEGIQPYSNVTITVSLKTGVQYYAWIKDTNGNIVSQSFSVSKVEI